MQDCRVCKGDLNILWDLGTIFPSNFIKADEVVKRFPLQLAQCTKCGLVQLTENPPLDSMYRKYWYKSSLNKSMLNDLKDVVISVEKRVPLKDGDVVVDIGCNDGALFDFYTNKNLVKIGFDPAENLKEEAKKHCNLFVNDYFGSADQLPNSAKVVTAIAMFYDLPDPVTFIRNVVSCLSPEGIAVIQFTDLYSMIKSNAFDNICHEHLCYYDYEYLKALFSRNGLHIFDVEYNDVNGGSIRIFASSSLRYLSASYEYNYQFSDKNHKFNIEGVVKSLEARVNVQKEKLMKFLQDCKLKGLDVGLLGASTKGNTLLQYYGIDRNLVTKAYEVNSDKFGLYTVGSMIPIYSEDRLLKDFPQYLLLLPWHFINNILNKEIIKQYLAEGGSIVVPLPEFKVYSAVSGEKSTGELVDSLITTVVKCFMMQESLMNPDLPDATRLSAAIKTQKLNARRNLLMRELDKRLGGYLTTSEKTYQ
jgi:hypothetical protein